MKTVFLSLWIALLFLLRVIAADDSPAKGLAPIKTVDYGLRGEFRVNDRHFFPIMLYDAPADEATLAQLREFGFNVLTCKAELCDSLPAHGFYGAVHRGKSIDGLSGVFLSIGIDSPALYYKKNLLLQTAEANAKAVVPNRPLMNAIGYWEDEPAGVVAGKLPAKEKYEDLVAAIDVSAPYLYPVPYQPVASVGEAVARARAATGGRKPLLPILQLFAWKAEDRYPTPEELRCMVFLSLVEGATGIGYYSYGHVTGQPKTTIVTAQPDLWNSVKSLNREAAELGPRLVLGEAWLAWNVEKASSQVRMKGIYDAAGGLVIAVNSSPSKQEVKLKWSGTSASVAMKSGGGQPIEAGQGMLTLVLQPFDVAILRTVAN